MSETVLVIGGGIGGLTAGALLAKHGYAVTVLEASREWGGCAGKFQRGAYTFPVGATLGMGFEPGGIHERIFRYLGAGVDVQRLDIVMKVNMPSQALYFYRDRARHVEQLQQAFPQYKVQIAAFYQDVYNIAREIQKLMSPLPILPPMTMKEWKKLVFSLSPTSFTLLPYFSRTLQFLLEKHGLLQAYEFVHFIDGQIIDSMQVKSDKCSMLLGCLALDMYHEGAFYVEGGLYKVAEALQKSIAVNGGTTKLGRQVVKLERKGPWIVTDHRENTYEAKHVICNMPIAGLQQLLSTEDYSRLSKQFREKAKIPQWGTFTLYIAIDEGALPADIPLFQQVLVSEDGEMAEGEHVFLSISHPHDRDRAPKGSRTLTVSTHIDLTKWQEQATYDSLKEEMTEKMLQVIRSVIPNIDEGLLHLIPGAPRAWERYTSRPLGGVGGLPQTLDHSLFRSVSHRTSLEGLWLCGDTVFPGAGTIGVSVSGYHVFQSITNHQHQLPK